MKTQIAVLVGVTAAKITEGQCGEGPTPMQNIDATRLTGEWFPTHVDKQSLEEHGFDGSCFKQKVGLPSDFKWVTEDSDESSTD